jgi:hypothetical protein
MRSRISEYEELYSISQDRLLQGFRKVPPVEILPWTATSGGVPGLRDIVYAGKRVE